MVASSSPAACLHFRAGVVLLDCGCQAMATSFLQSSGKQRGRILINGAINLPSLTCKLPSLLPKSFACKANWTVKPQVPALEEV